MFFIDHISPASILDPQAPIMDAPSEEHILDLNAKPAPKGAQIGWLTLFIIYKYSLCVLIFLYIPVS